MDGKPFDLHVIAGQADKYQLAISLSFVELFMERGRLDKCDEAKNSVRNKQGKFCSRLHDKRNIYVTLRQWRIFHAVIDYGGFAEAAAHLHLSQSTVSYTIRQMQEQLGIQLIQIVGRRARLTPAGKQVHDRSRQMLRFAIELEEAVKLLATNDIAALPAGTEERLQLQVQMQTLNCYLTPGTPEQIEEATQAVGNHDRTEGSTIA